MNERLFTLLLVGAIILVLLANIDLVGHVMEWIR